MRRDLVAWSLLALVTSATAAPGTVAEADRLTQAANPSVETLLRAIELYEQAAKTDARDATIQLKIAAVGLGSWAPG
jgi:hypothetical protein